MAAPAKRPIRPRQRRLTRRKTDRYERMTRLERQIIYGSRDLSEILQNLPSLKVRTRQEITRITKSKQLNGPERRLSLINVLSRGVDDLSTVEERHYCLNKIRDLAKRISEGPRIDDFSLRMRRRNP